MSFNMDDVQVGGQLRVGTGICNPIKEGDYKINGSAHIEGPMVVGLGQKIKLGAVGGDPDDPGDTTGAAPANLMVTRCFNDDRDCFTPAIKKSLQTEGNVLINGDDGTKNALKVTGSQSYQLWVEGNAYFDHPNIGDLSKRFTTADEKPKPFDMVHPSRGEGSRLRYACIEGPEVGIYCRGRVRRGKEIFLPKYWKDLVHVNSISVQLQPIGAHQDVIVKRWDEEKIYLQSMGGMPIDCFYHVYAERKDVNPLVVEYSGDSWEDYPDPDYNDPQFQYEVNTITG